MIEIERNKYGGVIIDFATCPRDKDELREGLLKVIASLSKEQLIWCTIPIDYADHIPIFTKLNFKYHHCDEERITVVKKVVDEAFVPTSRNFIVGVGAVVIQNNQLKLIIMKKYIVVTAIIVLLSGCASSKRINNGTIYKTDENKHLIYELYDSKLATWPVPYKIIDVQTRFGKTNIIASGDKNSPPVFLIHAMGMTATMWHPNVKELSKTHKVYVINTIGDLGKSELYDMDSYPKNGKDYANWLSDIMQELQLTKCDVIAASMGGWIAMNFAIYLPEKVNHLILLGPMGIKANTTGVMKNLFKVMLFPNQKNKEALTKWTLGESQKVNDELAEYMNTALNCEGRMPVPKHIKKNRLEKIEAKTLLILGEYDNPIGNPEKNIKFATQCIGSLKTEVVNTGHLMNLESPAQINSLMTEFLSN